MRTLLLALILLALAACGGPDTADGAEGRLLRVAVIPKGTAHEFWKAVEKGARRADAELEDLEIVWKGPTGEGNAAAQIEVVESFIADSYDGICLAPLDARALETPVRQAIGQGIPVVIFDSGLVNDGVPTISFVASDNYRGGEIAANELARLLDGRGNVVLMRYLIGSESTEQREAGFLDTIAKHPGITVLSNDKHGGPDESKAIEVGENLLATYGEQIDGIFCPNESNISGMLTVLRRDPRGLAGKVKLMGFDSSPNLITGLRDEILHGTVLQDPVTMGYEAVMAMHRHLKGLEVAQRIRTGETVATSANMDEPRVHELLFPLEDVH